jgi:predicted dehydrogenase
VCRERGVLLAVSHQRRFQPSHIARYLLARVRSALIDVHFDVHHYDLMTGTRDRPDPLV